MLVQIQLDDDYMYFKFVMRDGQSLSDVVKLKIKTYRWKWYYNI